MAEPHDRLAKPHSGIAGSTIRLIPEGAKRRRARRRENFLILL